MTVNDAARPSVTQIVNDAVAQCRQQTNGSEYDMALWLHDWTLDQLEYDHNLNWCSAESGLTRHQGTCESYQRIYAKLLDAAGIANGRITGNGHTWNAVKIDGKWCQMDLTWDDTSDNWYGDLDQRHLCWPDRRAHGNRPLRPHGKLPKGRLRLPLNRPVQQLLCAKWQGR
ncbi:MAG: transglutaminase domain-containing protein [Collinsella sp.]